MFQVKELLKNNKVKEAYELAISIYDKDKTNKKIICVLAELVFKYNSNSFFDFDKEVYETVKEEHHYLLYRGVNFLKHDLIDEAEEIFTKINETFKDNINFILNRATCKFAKGKKEEAEEFLNLALKLDPVNITALTQLADLSMATGKDSQAVALYDKVLKIAPTNYGAWNNKGNCHKNLLELDKSIECYNKALEINKEVGMLWTNLNHCESYMKEDLTESLNRFNKEFQPRNITEQFYNIKDPDRRIRIGFISPDFRSHSVNYFIQPLFKNFNKIKLEFYAFYDSHYSDKCTEEFKSLADNFTVVAGWTDEQVKAEVNKQQIDIMVDLSLHSGNNRLSMFRDYVSPVQISYLGCNVSPGLDSITSRLLCDTLITNLETRMSVEPLISLGETSVVFDIGENIPIRPEISAFEKNNFITFGSFNYPSKFSPTVFDTYSEILKQVENSKLYLKYKTLEDKTLRDKVINEFKLRGVSEDKLIIKGFTPKQLEEYFEVDIALDTFPYQGTTTTMDIVQTSTPFLSLAGNCANSRQGLMFSRNLGTEEDFIGFSPEEFISKAVRLANDKDKIKFYHRNLTKITRDSPLCDVKSFNLRLENCFRRLWQEYCHLGG